jgi:polyhydroxyalkanoate synthesis regulator phasin
MTRKPQSQNTGGSKNPIFLHSLWRAGSTYMFNVFRRAGDRYTCYQESIHEIAVDAREKPGILLDVTELGSLMRHPKLDRPYFQELYDANDAWRHLIDKDLIYRQYFDRKGTSELTAYLNALISASKHRPVFQECRTSGRIAAIKRIFSGYHIYLLRNPHDQWWSILKDHYFTNALLMVVNADDPPPLIQALKKQIAFFPYEGRHISEEFDNFDKYQYRLDVQYQIYFSLWCLAYVEAKFAADDIVFMDDIAANAHYRNAVLKKWQTEASIGGISLDDCMLPQKRFSSQELRFFEEIEERVFATMEECPETSVWVPDLREAVGRFSNEEFPELEVQDLRQIVAHVTATAAARVDWRQAELGTRLASVETDLAAARIQIDQLQALVEAQFESGRLSRQSEIDDLVNQASTARIQIDQLQALVEAQFESGRLSRQSEIDDLVNQASTARIQIDQLQALVEAQFESGRLSRQNEIDDLASRASALEAQIEDLNALIKQHSQTHDRLSIALDEADKKLADASMQTASQLEQISRQALANIRRQERAKTVLADLKARHFENMHDLESSHQQQIQALLLKLSLKEAESEALASHILQISNSPYGRIGIKLGLLASGVRFAVDLADPSLSAGSQSNSLSDRSNIKVQEMSDFTHVDQLMALNGSAFIDAIYRAFLKRSADRPGREHFLARLQAGDGKKAIIAAIASSPEARTMRTSISGVEKILAQSPKRRFRFPWGRRTDRALERAINRLEFSLGEAQNVTLSRLEQLETALEAVRISASQMATKGMRQKREHGGSSSAAKASITRKLLLDGADQAPEFFQRLQQEVRDSSEADALANPI